MSCLKVATPSEWKERISSYHMRRACDQIKDRTAVSRRKKATKRLERVDALGAESVCGVMQDASPEGARRERRGEADQRWLQGWRTGEAWVRKTAPAAACG